MTEPDHIEHVPVADDVALHVRRWDGHAGDDPDRMGRRTPVVLVHGLASNARLWDGVAAVLQAAGHPVAAVDQRGHGRSSKPDHGYDMATVADDLRRLLEHLATHAGFERPLVAGQSWGGNVVLELGARHPGLASAIACVDGGTIELQRQFETWEACAETLRPPPLAGTPRSQLEAMLRRSHPDWPESGIQGTLACFEVRDDDTIAPWLTLERHLLVLRGLWEHRPSQRYALVQEPVLLLGAGPGPEAVEDDAWQASKVRGMAEAGAALARGHVEWMLGDHDLHAQHPAAVAELLIAHARRGDPDPTQDQGQD